MLHTPLGTVPELWKKLWIAFRSQDDVALQYLAGIFNGSMVVERYGQDIVPRDEGFGLCSIDNLDPDLTISQTDSYYYHEMIIYLISIGYVPGQTLFGFPYDWRQSVRHGPALARLHTLIHNLHNSTHTPVDIMTHSMGGLIMKSYLDAHLEDADGVLGKWTAIGTPWRGGGSVAYKALISGYALDMTTIPILQWGLSEKVAHAVELNWPSTFELMPDVDHDNWWHPANLPHQPTVTYQMTSQPRTTANTSTEIKTLMQAVNAANMQVFAPGTAAVPNPVNMIAWHHADATRQAFFNLTQRLNDFRQQHPSATLQVYSMEGSKVATRYSLHFPRAVISVADLQTKTPEYTEVDGDGTVPHASSLSDGLGAQHMEYQGLSDHQRLLRTPEIFQGVRYALGHSCQLEGSWQVDLLDPNGHVFETRYWMFKDNEGRIEPNTRLNLTTDSFATTLPDGTPISGNLDRSCTGFAGLWNGGYRTNGRRILGVECSDPLSTKSDPVPHGQFLRNCVYGFWSNTSRLVCDEQYTPVNGECKKVEQGGKLPLIIFASIALVGILVLALVIGIFAYRRSKKRDDGGYRRVELDDPGHLSLDNSILNDDVDSHI